tara:strand:- start:197 stop:325 length:129 start_codon:yes stop_codon:yes gene_type:complete
MLISYFECFISQVRAATTEFFNNFYAYPALLFYSFDFRQPPH